MPDGKTYLPNSTFCFVCGEENHAGLQTRFYLEDGLVKARLDPRDHHCGYLEVAHGGITAAILDECMGWAATCVLNRMCYTGDLSIRYLKPVPLKEALTVCAEVVRSNKRMVQSRGWVEDAEGTVYVRGEGRFLPMTIEETLDIDRLLLYREGDARPFEGLNDAQSATCG